MIIHQHILIYKAEDGIRDLVRSRGLGDVYKRQGFDCDKMENVEFINLEELYNGRIDM